MVRIKKDKDLTLVVTEEAILDGKSNIEEVKVSKEIYELYAQDVRDEQTRARGYRRAYSDATNKKGNNKMFKGLVRLQQYSLEVALENGAIAYSLDGKQSLGQSCPEELYINGVDGIKDLLHNYLNDEELNIAIHLFVYGYSEQEYADDFGIAKSTLNSRKTKIIKKLQQIPVLKKRFSELK